MGELTSGQVRYLEAVNSIILRAVMKAYTGSRVEKFSTWLTCIADGAARTILICPLLTHRLQEKGIR